MRSYSEAIEFLYRMGWFGAKLGLENPRKLAALAGHPERGLRFLHVAGTNGKGSTCAMLESIYRHAGYRVGLYTSPHLVAFSERIQVNRVPIPENEIARHVSELEPLLAHFPPETHPTFFEVVTVLALRYFAEQACDLVVWETGIGGRLDATNIVSPLASIITNVQLDHQKWLGQTVTEIAREKAGIIKAQIPVFTAAQDPQVLQILRTVAAELAAPLTEIGPAETAEVRAWKLGLRGEHQRQNAALALALVRALQTHFPVPPQAIVAGLETVYWPGRFEIVRRGTQTVVLDGAHNPAGAEVLRAALAQYFASARPALIMGTMKDKDWRTMCRVLAPIANSIVIAPVASERSADPSELLAACRLENPAATVTLCGNVKEALALQAAAPLLVITGSLHFLGEAMEQLHLSPIPPRDERALNEWTMDRSP